VQVFRIERFTSRGCVHSYEYRGWGFLGVAVVSFWVMIHSLRFKGFRVDERTRGTQATTHFVRIAHSSRERGGSWRWAGGCGCGVFVEDAAEPLTFAGIPEGGYFLHYQTHSSK
jgi:hypothetical protein